MNTETFKKTAQQGFTLIETLVAITILMLAITGPLTVAHKGLTSSVYARDQMIASYLAQDAIEYVKNIRDTDKLQGRSWLYSFDANSQHDCVTGNCTVDTVKSEIYHCSGACTTSGILYTDDTVGGYFHRTSSGVSTAGIATQFNRVVRITVASTSASEATLAVTVSWHNGTVANAVTIDDDIFDTFR
jgi:prepilin-type N-terminal cleavage/methylation domain-containing protein